MNELVVSIVLGCLGVFFGSFAGASMWRLRARQLVEDKEAGGEVDSKELKRLKAVIAPIKSDRSQCLHCHHQLAWYDLVPLVSWIVLKGKCRYCRHRIGMFEPLIEIGTALFFVVSFMAWPYGLSSPLEILHFVMWLGVGVGLIVLFCYDVKWFLLPDKIVFPLIAVATVHAVIVILTSTDHTQALVSVAGSCLVLSGLYFMLYVLSKGAWVGFGDIKLGLILGLMLADWQLAFLTLFLANVIGCVVVLPGLVVKRLTRYSHVPFGPMLILGFWISGLWGAAIIEWYLRFSFPYL